MRIFTAACAAALLTACIPPSAWDMPEMIGAARDGNTGRLEQLLKDGADPNVRAGVNGWTPLLHAIHKNQPGSVAVLIANNADVDAPGNGGVTPLIMASGYGYTEIVRQLLEAGARPGIRAANGTDALDAAVGGTPDIDRFTVGRCQTDTVKLLLAADRTLSVAPSETVARFAGCRDVVQLLEQRRRQIRERKPHQP